MPHHCGSCRGGSQHGQQLAGDHDDALVSVNPEASYHCRSDSRLGTWGSSLKSTLICAWAESLTTVEAAGVAPSTASSWQEMMMPLTFYPQTS